MRIATTLLLVLCMNFSFAQSDQEDTKQTKEQEIKELIKSGTYIFEANKTFQDGGGMVDLTTNPNFVKIDEGYVEADLPFFGETYRVHDMSGDAGINFEGEIINYKETLNESKNKIDIRFEVSTTHDKYMCFLTIFYSGRATLDINSVSKSNARYLGKVDEIDKK